MLDATLKSQLKAYLEKVQKDAEDARLHGTRGERVVAVSSSDCTVLAHRGASISAMIRHLRSSSISTAGLVRASVPARQLSRARRRTGKHASLNNVDQPRCRSARRASEATASLPSFCHGG